MITILPYLALILLPIVTRNLNRLRGKGSGEKTIWYAILAALITVALLPKLTMHSAFLLFFCLWLSHHLLYGPGWGKYFPHGHDRSHESEGWTGEIVEICTIACLGYQYTSLTPGKKAVRWKTVAMGFRFALCSIPKYMFLTLVLLQFHFLLGIIAVFSAGFIYRHYYRKADGEEATQPSEKGVGLMIGAVDAVLIALAYL